MNTSALVLMLSSVLTVTGFTLYFFYRVLTTPPKPEPDSFSDNDPEP
ncbi:MAG: hypothetical protein IPJ87_17560 [Flavobacteriales bacterium]|jgi:hypothetical protein|nr:hypothetical protein [Flavobacteriales bacterium]MBK7943653.1 hypothetical protein [Flavobacteriales bacterium]MBK8950538.1 hypothetical protein [Flavobacteriales bacterium]MBK9699663.1 hypothetical protein [Flavobacteriales bacterium]